MKNLMKSKQFLLIVSTMLCIIIGLLATLAVFLKAERLRKASETQTYRTEMEIAAGSFLLDTDKTVAYHHIRSASDYAMRAGELAGAELFGDIASRVLSGDITEEMKYSVESFLNTDNLSPPENRAHDNPAVTSLKSNPPSYISSKKYKFAEDRANRLFGSTNIFTSGIRTNLGAYLFTCDNAYVIIDERTLLPMEGAVSLDANTLNLSRAECITNTAEYLGAIFPSIKHSFKEPVEISEDESTGIVNLLYETEQGEIRVSVSLGSGKIVKFIKR